MMWKKLASLSVVVLTGLGVWLGVLAYRAGGDGSPGANPVVRTIEWRGADSGYRGRTLVHEDGTHEDAKAPTTRPATEP